MNDNIDRLLDRLRLQQGTPPVQQQQSHQGQYSQGTNNMYSPPPEFSEQYHHAESSVYSPHTSQPQSSTPGMPAPGNSFLGFGQQPAPSPPSHLQYPEPAQSNNQSPAISAAGHPPPYNLPMSPSADMANANRTASLLQLLKFSHAGPSDSQPEPSQAPTTNTIPRDLPDRPGLASPPPPPPLPSEPSQDPPSHNRAISASDLVASLFGRQSAEPNAQQQGNSLQSGSTSPVQSRTAPEHTPQREKSPVNPQDLVFQLLGRPKPVQDDRSTPAEGQNAVENSGEVYKTSSPAQSTHSSELQSPGPTPPVQSEPISSSIQVPSKGLFTYVNPFEQLHATSPRNRTPKASTPTPGSNLRTNGTRAENIPLPFSPPVVHAKPISPPAVVEANAAKDAASLDQVMEREHDIMENGESLAQHEDVEHPEREVKPAPEQPVNREYVSTTTPDTLQKDSQTIAPDVKKHRSKEEDEDAYESAPESAPVEVYNFPMKPFSSITIVPSAITRPKYPVSKVADIARMSRSFDQLDRNLIAASHDFIVYAISKSNGRGGIRIIRQIDGKDKVMMKDSMDRTFNVTVGKGETVLATGVSGAVVWAQLMEDFDHDAWNSMFMFPPSEEQGQSNGVLKSRARKTSRLINVFAIGRGKTISIIHAPTAKAYAEGRKGNEVASKKYLSEHARTIDTGKASKDFAFSDDDTVIISIDKAGKLKLWDVQELVNFADNDSCVSMNKPIQPEAPMVLSTPALMFSAVAAGESYRATSVMFLDKFRPYHKCLALRYVIVGMKQNHTLQLWDLALGRPVQEINFPQESETDPLCSVAYHPLSGIIIVGNPTRNSICFIHLSAPKYNLPVMSQAEYIKGLANKDPSIPKPEATAILSGLREYSFASKGQLMSLDLLDVSENEPQGEESPALFELYVAHSKGMTTLNVYKEDLGWEVDNRVKNPVDAVAKGVCTLKGMPAPPPEDREKEKDAPSEAGDSVSTTANNALRPKVPEVAAKGKSRSTSPAARTPQQSDVGEDKPGVVNGAGKKSKRGTPSNAKAVTSPPAGEPQQQELNIGVSSSFLDREVKRFEKTVSGEFAKVLGKELEQLYRRFDDDRRVQQASNDAKQEAILRLLSTTLTENVEQVISRIVVNNIQAQVVPAIADVTAAAIDRRLADSLSRALSLSLPAELQRVIPDAVRRTMTQPDITSRISESLTAPLTKIVELEFSHTLSTTIVPTFQRLAVDAVNKVVVEADQKQNETIRMLEDMHQQDSRKIEQLMSAVQSMSETIAGMAKSQSDMAKAQADFQDQVRQAQAEYSQSYDSTAAPTPQQPKPQPKPQKTPEQLEAEEIEGLLRSGRYEDGTIKWLQSKERQAELFDEVMVRYRYDPLPNLSQLVLLSVSAAVSVKFEHKIMERLSWLEGVLAVLDPMDLEIHEICHRIMVVVVQRLEQLYMNTAEKNMQNPILRKIPSIARRARELSAMCG